MGDKKKTATAKPKPPAKQTGNTTARRAPSKAQSSKRAVVRDAPPMGVEVDPNESFELMAMVENDSTVYTLDKRRCVKINEVTNQQRDPSASDFILRQFFTRPSTRETVASGVTTKYCDARGVYLQTKEHSVRVQNLSQAPIIFMATTANTPDSIQNQIGARTMLADNVVINPGKSKTFKVNRGGMYPYIFKDSEGKVHEHIFDGYIKVPDIPPQDQSDLSNEITETADGVTVNRQRRVWSEDAEVASISVRTKYLVQQAPKEYALERLPAHPLKFSADWGVPYGHTVQTYISSAGKLVGEEKGMNITSSYDLTGDGWLGMGIAFLQDSYANATVAYLAKFKTPVSIRGALPGIPPKEQWEQLTEAEREEVMAGILSDYPAYRNAALEDTTNTLYLPMGAGFNYDASGNDLSQISNAFRWSEEHLAFVLWDFCRGRPLYIESGWAHPNYYQQWVASMPPKGWLTISNSQGIENVKLHMELDQRYLMEKAISWDLVVFALTVLIEVVKGISKISSEMRRSAPQG